MNLSHLRYAVEVEKMRSINKAAESLFMGQPNLSRAIKELEEYLGINIFKRTSKGMVPTESGKEFLSYAKNILAQVDKLEYIYRKADKEKQKFTISVPRASYISKAFVDFVDEIDKSQKIEFSFKETNAMRAINNIVHSNYNLGIIRYQKIFDDYFKTMFHEKGLKHEKICEFSKLIVMSKNNKLAKKEKIYKDDLTNCIEIIYGDPYVPSMPIYDVKKAEFSEFTQRKIFVFERGSQFDILNNIHDSYTFDSKLPDDMLSRYNLIEKKCLWCNKIYKDVLIYGKNYYFTNLDKAFIEKVYEYADKFQNNI